MLSTIQFLLYGETGTKPENLLSDVSCFYLISKNKPVRNVDGKPLSKSELTQDLENRLVKLGMSDFQAPVSVILEKLEAFDEALHFFVLVSTYYLPDEKFEKSLKKLAIEQNLVTKYNGEFKSKLYSEPLTKNGVPQLPWDISPVLNQKYFDIQNFASTSDDPLISCPSPVDNWGLLSKDFQKNLKNEPLLKSSREGRPIEFYQLSSSEFNTNVINMYQGKSSYLFQINAFSQFYQAKCCQVEEKWNLTKTRTILLKHIEMANKLSEVRKSIKTNFVSRRTENQMRWMIQEFVRDEQYIFWLFLEKIVKNDDDLIENQELSTILENIPKIEENNNNLEFLDKLYEMTSGFYHVLKQMFHIFMTINDHSPINLNEQSYLGSQSAPIDYSRRMWRRLNVRMTKFIVKEVAEMLTSGDAELFELLTDTVDIKLIKDPSIWQRLNPLKLDCSIVMETSLSNKLVDLIIGYRFFINDKKSQIFKDDMDTFARSDIQDAQELELFAKSKSFEDLLNKVLSIIDNSKMTNIQDELSDCIEELIENLPTASLVEKYSIRFLKDSRRFFEFLKKFFTSAYIHANKADTLNMSLLTSMDDKKIRSLGYDPEFCKSIGISAKSSFEDQILHLTPPEPLNVYLSDGIVSVYSQIYTIMNMLQTALDAVIETHNCETLRHEPRLRYAFFHMNTTVFAIRKNMMSLIEAAYETMMKETNFENSKAERSAHDWLNVCYRAHRKFVREVALILMLSVNRGSTSRIIKMMVSSVSLASKACTAGDAVATDRQYQLFLNYLTIFLDQCRLDRNRYTLYHSLEIGEDSTDGKSVHSSYSDDISCRSY